MKKLLYGLIATALIAQNNLTNAALTLGGQGEDQLGGTATNIDAAIIKLITILSSFAALLAVLYAIFGGFTILTAAGDEEKVKKGRTILFHAILGLIVIFLAYSIINWIVNIVLVP